MQLLMLVLDKMKSQRKIYINYILLPLASTLVIFLLFEIILRIFLPQERQDLDHPPIFLPDDSLGHRLRSNYQSKNVTKNLNYSISTDAYGNRLSSSEFDSKYPTIIGIGDSYTFGHGVNNHETYLEQLKSLMQKKDYMYNIINLGVCGYGTHNALRNLNNFLEIRPSINPNIILLGFFLGNDFEDNARAISPQKHIRYTTLFIKIIFGKFHTYRFVRSAITKLMYKARKKQKNDITSSNEKAGKSLSSDDNKVIWGKEETLKYLIELNDLVKKLNSEFIILIMPDLNDIKNSNIKRDYIKSICKQKQIAFLDLHQGMLKILGLEENNFQDNIYFKENYYNPDNHWNSRGHKVAAQFISNNIPK